MNQDTVKARALLEAQELTCVVCRDEKVYTATERGVKPLLSWLDSGEDLTGFYAADKVVGRATAFLYVLLGIREVYAHIMSRPAAQVLAQYGVSWQAGQLVEGIINRRKDGPCPFEEAVLNITDPNEALESIRRKMVQMNSK